MLLVERLASWSPPVFACFKDGIDDDYDDDDDDDDGDGDGDDDDDDDD